MAEYEHDGCVGCEYDELSGNDMPCKICKQNILPYSKFRNKAPDMYEPIEQVQKQSKLPSKINQEEFEQQMDSLSIKCFVHQVKYLAKKINEILTYLEESM